MFGPAPRSISAIRPIRPDLVNHGFASFLTMRGETVAGGFGFEEIRLQDTGQSLIGGFMDAENGTMMTEIAPEMDRPRQSRVILQAFQERIDSGIAFLDER